jgi:hypothetical protein
MRGGQAQNSSVLFWRLFAYTCVSVLCFLLGFFVNGFLVKQPRPAPSLSHASADTLSLILPQPQASALHLRPSFGALTLDSRNTTKMLDGDNSFSPDDSAIIETKHPAAVGTGVPVDSAFMEAKNVRAALIVLWSGTFQCKEEQGVIVDEVKEEEK